MSRCDVLLIAPGDHARVYQGLAKEHAIEPPAMARWIASYLLRRDVRVEIIDQLAEHLTPDQIGEHVKKFDPTLVVVAVYGSQPSASTQTMPAARDVAEAIKKLSPFVKIAFTGTHPTALPERTLREESIDFVIEGEGPSTIHDLYQSLKLNGGFSRVPGLWYWIDDWVAHTQPAHLIDLNNEPAQLGWKLLDLDKYYAHDWHTNYQPYRTRTPYANIMTTLGCPFSCTFCCIQAPFRPGEAVAEMKHSSYRFWSPELVVLKEIEYLVENWGVRHIKIPDEMFVLNERHVLAIADGIAKKYKDQLNIWAYARIDTVRKPEILERLRRAGFRWLCYGIESANSVVRDGQEKGFKDEDIIKVVSLTQRHGIEVAANFIFGLPGDTLASMQQTLDLAKSINSPFANFYATMAYPGSALYRIMEEKGVKLPGSPGGPGWIGYSQHSYETLPLPTETLAAAQVLAFRDEAVRNYYSRPEFLQMLEMRPGFGSTAVKTIKETLSRLPLKRRLLGD